MLITIQHAGTSGTWRDWPETPGSLAEAMSTAEGINADGYEVRLIIDGKPVGLDALKAAPAADWHRDYQNVTGLAAHLIAQGELYEVCEVQYFYEKPWKWGAEFQAWHAAITAPVAAL